MQSPHRRGIKSNGNQSGIDPLAQILSKLRLRLELQLKSNRNCFYFELISQKESRALQFKPISQLK